MINKIVFNYYLIVQFQPRFVHAWSGPVLSFFLPGTKTTKKFPNIVCWKKDEGQWWIVYELHVFSYFLHDLNELWVEFEVMSVDWYMKFCAQFAAPFTWLYGSVGNWVDFSFLLIDRVVLVNINMTQNYHADKGLVSNIS